MTEAIWDLVLGTVINISSCSAKVTSINREEYFVSKAGIAMATALFVDLLAQEEIFCT